MKFIDGIGYESDDDIPDLGHWECIEIQTSSTGKTIRSYFGVSSEVSKLPTSDMTGYETMGASTSAYCVDNGALYMYNPISKTWVEQ